MSSTIVDLVKIAAERGASDILWVPGTPPQMKIHVALFPIPKTGFDGLTNEEQQGQMRATVEQLLRISKSSLTLDRFIQDKLNRHGYGEIMWTIGEGAETLRLRTSVYHTMRQIAIVIRLLPQRIFPFEEIFAVPGYVGLLKPLLLRQNGLILITGPTGTGKTTTIATCVDHMLKNRKGEHIITLEDPIEFLFPRRGGYQGIISQREYGEKEGEGDFPNFAEAIVAGMRQSPNVFVVAEIRDLKTAEAALRAAETGHLVIATLHTRDAAETVLRYVNIFPEEIRSMVRTQFSATILGILCQKLIPRADGKGRVACFEMVRVTPAYANMITEGHIKQLASQAERTGELILFDAYMVKLVILGLVAERTGRAYANDPAQFESLLKASRP